MKNFLKNLFSKTVRTVESASEDIKQVVDAVTEDAGKLMTEAKEKLSEAEEIARKEFTERVGDPSELIQKAKDAVADAGQKFKEAAAEEWEGAKEKFEELKDSLTKEELSETGEAIKKEFTGGVEDAADLKEKVEDTVADAGQKVKDAAAEGENIVKEELEELTGTLTDEEKPASEEDSDIAPPSSSKE